ALTAEIGERVTQKLLRYASASVFGVNDQVVDAPAIMRLAQRLERDEPDDYAVFLGEINGRTDMKTAGNPVLPERQTGAHHPVFLAESFVGNRFVLMTKQSSDLSRVRR